MGAAVFCSSCGVQIGGSHEYSLEQVLIKRGYIFCSKCTGKYAKKKYGQRTPKFLRSTVISEYDFLDCHDEYKNLRKKTEVR